MCRVSGNATLPHRRHARTGRQGRICRDQGAAADTGTATSHGLPGRWSRLLGRGTRAALSSCQFVADGERPGRCSRGLVGGVSARSGPRPCLLADEAALERREPVHGLRIVGLGASGQGNQDPYWLGPPCRPALSPSWSCWSPEDKNQGPWRVALTVLTVRARSYRRPVEGACVYRAASDPGLAAYRPHLAF